MLLPIRIRPKRLCLLVDPERGGYVQPVGKQSLIVHHLDDLEHNPSTGDSQKVTYRENKKGFSLF